MKHSNWNHTLGKQCHTEAGSVDRFPEKSKQLNQCGQLLYSPEIYGVSSTMLTADDHSLDESLGTINKSLECAGPSAVAKCSTALPVVKLLSLAFVLLSAGPCIYAASFSWWIYQHLLQQ